MANDMKKININEAETIVSTIDSSYNMIVNGLEAMVKSGKMSLDQRDVVKGLATLMSTMTTLMLVIVPKDE